MNSWFPPLPREPGRGAACAKTSQHPSCLCLLSSRSSLGWDHWGCAQCCPWEGSGVPWCPTCLNSRGNKCSTAGDPMETSAFIHAELALSFNDSSWLGIAPPTFSGVVCLILLSIPLQKISNMEVLSAALPLPRTRWEQGCSFTWLPGQDKEH